MAESVLNVLVVEEDSETLELLRNGLTKNNFSVLTAASAAEAQALLCSRGFETFGALLASYRLSGTSGLELFRWLREKDDSLAMMLFLKPEERDTISEIGRTGVLEFLDKPVILNQVRVAVTRAMARTREMRTLIEHRNQVELIGQVHHQLIGLQEMASIPQVTFRFHPRHGVGGDFSNVYPLSTHRYLIVTGDVSGHDLKAAFVSAYFQGITRGMIEKGAPIQEVFSFFNRYLTTEWKSEVTGVTMSLAACSLLVDLQQATAEISSFGFPLPYVVSEEGKIQRCRQAGSPLGWFEALEVFEERISSQGGGAVYLWSDGIEELADSLGISPLALIYRMLFSEEGEEEVKAQATDDLMFVKFRLQKEIVSEEQWRPIFECCYAADQDAGVDGFQEDWKRNIQYAVPFLLEEQLYDVLLALRESALNGMIHGAHRDPEKEVGVNLSVSPDGGKIRVRVEDPGPGHGYDLSLPMEELQPQFHDEHSGLTMLKFLATEIRIERGGAVIMMDFEVKRGTT